MPAVRLLPSFGEPVGEIAAESVGCRCQSLRNHPALNGVGEVEESGGVGGEVGGILPAIVRAAEMICKDLHRQDGVRGGGVGGGGRLREFYCGRFFFFRFAFFGKSPKGVRGYILYFFFFFIFLFVVV